MPIYEYRCSACGHDLEALQKFSDAPLLTCPACHKDALVKRVSAAGFQLKGSGWYATDFKGGAKPAPTKTDGGAAADSGATGEGAGKTGGKDNSAAPASSAAKSESASDAKSKSETKSDTSGSGTKSAKAGATPSST